MYSGFHNTVYLLNSDFLMLVHKSSQRILERMIRGFVIVKHIVKDIIIKALKRVSYFRSYPSLYPNDLIKKAFKQWADVKQLDLYLVSIVIDSNLICFIQINLSILNDLNMHVAISLAIVDIQVAKRLATVESQAVIKLVVKITMDFLVNLAAI